MYIKWRLKAEGQGSSSKGQGKLASCILYLASVVSAVLAMKTKEIAFTLPVIVVLYEFMFLKGKVIKRVLYLIPFLITMLIIPLSFISMDRPIDELISDVGEATRVQSNISRLDYLFTEMRVVITYIRLLLVPLNQMLDYNYPIYHSLFDFKVFLSFLFLLSIFSIAVYFTCRSSTAHKGLRLTAFGIFWFFITLSVESSLIPIRDVIFEHRVYLPSIGIFFVISSVVFNVARKFNGKGQKAAVLLFAVVVLV
ncbi:MAG: tetratricopeptide repeat protein, partial [Nitrospirae bacterium]|nr:tetratricopeptide repeat protein [Nitrospirota bacterium]